MGPLSRRDNTYLLALLNNDAEGTLADMAREELAARGALPSWATAPANVQDNLAAAASPIAPDPVVATPVRPGYQRGVPGPRTDDGRPVAPAPEFATQEEAEQYWTRPTDPETGRLRSSAADEAMAARGSVPVYSMTDPGEIVYRRGFRATSEDGQGGIEVGRPPNARVGREHHFYLNHRVEDPVTGAMVPAWETQSMDGPTGTFDVLVPSAASRARQAQRAAVARRARLHAAAGIPESDETVNHTDDELRQMGRNRREADLRDRRAAVVRRAQAQQNPLEYLGRDDVNDWQKMVMADRMLRAGAGQMTPLGVEAVGGQNALNMLRGMNLGQGMDNPLFRAQAAEAAAQVENNAATRQQEMLDWAESHVSANYASPQGWENWISRTFGSPHDVTEFTVAEQDKAIRALMARYPHLTLAQAQQIIDSVGSTRTTRPRPAAAE